MTKKILSLFCALSIIFGILPAVGYAADGTLYEASKVIEKGKTEEFKFNTEYSENITIEADYDLTETSWDNYCNIPFIVMAGTTELGRVSVFSPDEELLKTRIQYGNTVVETGVAERKGKFIIDVDYSQKRLVYKWSGSGIKEEAVLGYSNFTSDLPVSGLTIGAGGNPGITANVRAYKTDKITLKTKYTFNSAYSGALNGFSEFSRGTSGVVMAKDPKNENNGVLKIPAGEKLDMIFMPIDYGFSGTVSLKHRVYAAAKEGEAFSVEQFYQYITGSTEVMAKTDYTAYNTLCVTGNGDTRMTDSGEYLNCWVDIEYLFDFKNDTLLTRVNGKALNLSKDGSKKGELLNISDFKLINRMSVSNEKYDIYLDDISVSEVDEPQIYSDMLTINEDTMKISGLAQNAMCDALINKITVINGTIGVYSTDGTEKTGVLCKGDYLLLRDYNNLVEKKYLIMGYTEDILQGEKRAKEPSYHSENNSIASGKDSILNIGGTYTDDITVELDYDLTGTEWEGDCNIPMILLDGNGSEIGRISIYSQNSEILSTRMEGKSIIKTGGVGRFGTIKLETDLKNSRLVFKYDGAGYKRSATIGYIPFKNESVTSFGGVKIGASKNPGITVDMRVYENSSSAMKTEYTFDCAYTGPLSDYYDFNSSDSGVIIASDPENKDNGCAYVPSEKLWRMSFMPIDCGFSDEIKLKYKLYLSGDTVANASLVNLQEYKTGQTNDIMTLRAVSKTALTVLSGGKSYGVELSESLMNRWVEVECYLNLNECTARVTVDKTVFKTEDGSEYFPIESFSLFNQIQTRNTSCDMYIDNLEIAKSSDIRISSDAFTIDNADKSISNADITLTAKQLTDNISCETSLEMCVVNSASEEKTGTLAVGDMLKVTDTAVETSVYYSISYRNERIDFENGSNVSFTGGVIAAAPYDGGYALKSLSGSEDKLMKVYLPADKEYDTVEFKLYLENNTAAATVTVDNANDGKFSKMYFYNQETIAFLSGDDALLHPSTTRDRSPQRFKAVIDKEKEAVTWYMDGRKLNTEPIELANLYDKENTLSSVSVSVSAGAYAYIDDIVVSKSAEFSPDVTSEKYSVDNEYKMITGVGENTTAEEFINSVTPKGYVISADGRIKSNDELIKTGDGICFIGKNASAEYAVGQNDPAKNNLSAQYQTKLYVSSNGSDSASGSAEEPFKTLQKAFEEAAEIDGNVCVEILNGGLENSSVKNVKKTNGSIILTSKNELTGGKTFGKSDFRSLTDEEKAIFTGAPDKILVAELGSFNVGKTVQSGWNLPFVPSSAELVVNGKTQTPARYPNEGYITSGEISSSSSKELTFKYSDTRSEKWKTAENARIWSHFDVAYGGYDIGIDNINTDEKTVTVKGKMYSTNVSKPFDYYYYNIPEELDAPGEYYIDAEKGLLYYYPDNSDINAVLTDGSSAVLSIRNCENVLLDGIRVIGGRGNGIEIIGCESVEVRNGEISGCGMNGIVITGGRNCGASNSSIHHIGGDAIKLCGGDSYTLTKAGHFVKNCDIHDFSLRKKSYTSAVTTSGCGMEICENKIYNAPHTALFLRSCDTDIYKNSFMNTTYDAEDMGCIYSVDTYTRRGITINDNYFENIRNKYKDGTGLVKCVYLDNFTSGWEVYNNVFYNCDQGIHANGGRENSIRDNLFAAVDFPLGMYSLLNAGFTNPPLYQANFAPVGSRLWKKAYPGASQITAEYPGYPNNTEAHGNVTVGAKTNRLDFSAHMSLSDSVTASGDKLNGELITDYSLCEKVAEITENIIADGILIDGLVPFMGEMHIKKGEERSVRVRIDGKALTPDSVESSNETVVQTDENKISAVNPGTATVKVKYGAFERTIKIVCEQ